MNTQALSQHYERFTAEERVRLVLAAVARKDIEEATRLMASCPQMTLVGPDPEYPKLFGRVEIASANALFCWLDASHLVIRYRMAVDAFKLLALVCESPDRVDRYAEGEDTENPEAIVRECRAAGGKAKVKYRFWLLALGGRLFMKMGIPLSELPAQVIIWSGDRDLVTRARWHGLTAVVKGNPEDLIALLREVYQLDGLDAA